MSAVLQAGPGPLQQQIDQVALKADIDAAVRAGDVAQLEPLIRGGWHNRDHIAAWLQHATTLRELNVMEVLARHLPLDEAMWWQYAMTAMLEADEARALTTVAHIGPVHCPAMFVEAARRGIWSICIQLSDRWLPDTFEILTFSSYHVIARSLTEPWRPITDAQREQLVALVDDRWSRYCRHHYTHHPDRPLWTRDFEAAEVTFPRTEAALRNFAGVWPTTRHLRVAPAAPPAVRPNLELVVAARAGETARVREILATKPPQDICRRAIIAAVEELQDVTLGALLTEGGLGADRPDLIENLVDHLMADPAGVDWELLRLLEENHKFTTFCWDRIGIMAAERNNHHWARIAVDYMSTDNADRFHRMYVLSAQRRFWDVWLRVLVRKPDVTDGRAHSLNAYMAQEIRDNPLQHLPETDRPRLMATFDDLWAAQLREFIERGNPHVAILRDNYAVAQNGFPLTAEVLQPRIRAEEVHQVPAMPHIEPAPPRQRSCTSLAIGVLITLGFLITSAVMAHRSSKPLARALAIAGGSVGGLTLIAACARRWLPRGVR
jgi:hypothetical protein